jgi:hypothetical protein
MEKVTTPYVLKLRTDQWYGNLVPFFDAVRKQPNKFICSNLHFRPDHICKYHPSDKLIGTNTKDMLETFRIASHRVKNEVVALMAGAYMYTENTDIISEKDLFNDIGLYSYGDANRKLATNYLEKPLLGTIQIFPAGYIGVVPEVVIGTSYLLAKGVYPAPNKSISIVKEHFDIVKVEDMVPYVNKFGTNEIEHNFVEIHNIEDYG